jgi:hypothetical protein
MANFSPYVLRKMARRQISRDDVELVLADYDATFPSATTGRPIYVRTVDDRRIHVVVETDDEDTVVTAFVPEETELGYAEDGAIDT